MNQMKRLTAAALFALGLLAAGNLHAGKDHIEIDLVNDPTVSYSQTYTLDVSEIDQLSMQAIYADAEPSTFSCDDGAKSTGTITVLSTSSITTAKLIIGDCRLDQGDEWTAVDTASGTASAIATAINASNCLSSVIVSSYPGTGAVVYTTATALGSAGNSIDFESNNSSITVSGFSNGDDANISTADDDFTFTSPHNITTGLALLLDVVSGTVPTGLTDATTYYAIINDDVSFKLATTSTGAVAGVNVDITAITGSGGFTLTPLAFAGTWSWKWQGSNDNSNWFDLPISAVTYSADSNTMWDGEIRYKHLRLNFTAGTAGGMNLRVIGYGRRRR